MPRLIITLLIITVLNYAVDGAKVISLSDDDMEEDYEMVEGMSNHQTFDKLTILLNTYTHRQSHKCAKVLTLQVNDAEFYLDAVTVSCDVNPPFPQSNGVVNVKDVVYVSAPVGSAVWAIYQMGMGYCIRRKYTDQSWTPLDVVVDEELSTKQCSKLLETYASTKDVVEHAPVSEEPLPDFQNPQGKILMIGDILIEDYLVGDKNYKELDGASMKMIVTRTTHSKSRQCRDIVFVDLKSSDDLLDCAQLTCDESAFFVKTRGLLVYRGLVYVRDHPDDAVWVVYRQPNRCQLRVYTDKQKALVETKVTRLTLEQCKVVVETQRIDQLPQTSTGQPESQSKKPLLVQSLADIQRQIAQQPQAASTPPAPSQGPLPPQPVGLSSPSLPLASQPLDSTPQPVTLATTTGPQDQTHPSPTPRLTQQPSPAIAPTTIDIVHSPPSPPPAPGIFSGLANKFGGLLGKFGRSPPSSPPTARTVPLETVQASPAAVPTGSDLTPATSPPSPSFEPTTVPAPVPVPVTAPATVTVTSTTVPETSTTVPVTSTATVPEKSTTVPVTSSDPAPMATPTQPTPPPKKPWWSFW